MTLLQVGKVLVMFDFTWHFFVSTIWLILLINLLLFYWAICSHSTDHSTPILLPLYSHSTPILLKILSAFYSHSGDCTPIIILPLYWCFFSTADSIPNLQAILLLFYDNSTSTLLTILLPFFWWLYSHSTCILLLFFWWLYSHVSRMGIESLGVTHLYSAFYHSTDDSTPIQLMNMLSFYW